MSEEKKACPLQGKISLAGDLGSGKSTVSNILIERLSATYYSTGAICRAIAAKHGMTIVEMNKYMETHPELDREIDDGLVALSDLDKMMVIDSRMAWHFVKGNFSVYMTTELETSATRIFLAGRAQEKYASVEEAMVKIKEREASGKKRYKEKYGVDRMDLFNYSLVIDTTKATPDEICDCILSCADMWCIDNNFRACYYGYFCEPWR